MTAAQLAGPLSVLYAEPQPLPASGVGGRASESRLIQPEADRQRRESRVDCCARLFHGGPDDRQGADENSNPRPWRSSGWTERPGRSRCGRTDRKIHQEVIIDGTSPRALSPASFIAMVLKFLHEVGVVRCGRQWLQNTRRTRLEARAWRAVRPAMASISRLRSHALTHAFTGSRKGRSCICRALFAFPLL